MAPHCICMFIISQNGDGAVEEAMLLNLIILKMEYFHTYFVIVIFHNVAVSNLTSEIGSILIDIDWQR